MNGKPEATVDWAGRRRQMVERQIEARGVRDSRVLHAMLEIPREEFVPQEHRHMSCNDEPIWIGFGQTISQPYMTALMAECLNLTGVETVLEVGAGCGYHAAVLGALAARVITIEILPELADMARRNLAETGWGSNVLVVCGDGSCGYPGSAPYDAISVAAAAEEVPAALLEQLGDPGILVIPVGSSWDQELRVITRHQGKTECRVPTHCRFVPLRTGAGGE